jgi:hypothetical protein
MKNVIKNTIKKAIIAGVTLLLTMLLMLIAMGVAVNTEYAAAAYSILVAVAFAGAIATVLFHEAWYAYKREKHHPLSETEYRYETKKLKRKSITVTLSVIVLMIFISLSNSSIFHSEEFAASLSVKPVEKTDVNITSQRSVTKTMALVIAKNIIGKKHNGVQISSQYELSASTASVQKVNGELTWIIPLDYSGFFKWLNQDSIPGYVMVSATNPRAKAELKLGYEIKISKSGYFFEDIERVIYFKSGLREADTHMEVDEDGKPYYISSIQTPSTFYTNYKTTKVFVTDAQTTETVEYNSVKEAKEANPWIDRMVSEEYMKQRIEWFGSMQDGWINAYFTGNNVNKPTSYNGSELWLLEVNEEVHYFTGMTSSNSNDSSLVSGIFVNAVTSESIEIDLAGVMDESGAIKALNGILGAEAARWSPVLPQPFIKNNEFFWGSPIVSNEGIFQKVGMVQGDEQSNTMFAKSFADVFGKTNFAGESLDQEASDSETIEVNKKVYLQLLKALEEVDRLKKLL